MTDGYKAMSIAPTNDDQWFWFMAILNGYRIRIVPGAMPMIRNIEGTQDCALGRVNDLGPHRFWRDFMELLKNYPEAEKILNDEFINMYRTYGAGIVPDEYRNEDFYRELVNYPDDIQEMELCYWYKNRTGKELNIKEPRTWGEKLQWMKLYDNTPIKTRLTDKYLVRDWVREKIGEEYLIPLLGMWRRVEDIDFEKLPDQFVLKANHGSAWNIIVTDKSEMNWDDVRDKLNLWLHSNYSFKVGQELHYWNIEPCIIAEKFIKGIDDLRDYKFLCFNGEVKYLWIDSNRFTNHRRDVYTPSGEWIDVQINDSYYNSDVPPELPDNLQEMVSIAERLCEEFPHVRVDLYDVRGRIYFGEMTFTSGSGIENITPNSFDIELGSYITLPEKYVPDFGILDREKMKTQQLLTQFDGFMQTLSYMSEDERPEFERIISEIYRRQDKEGKLKKERFSLEQWDIVNCLIETGVMPEVDYDKLLRQKREAYKREEHDTLVLDRYTSKAVRLQRECDRLRNEDNEYRQNLNHAKCELSECLTERDMARCEVKALKAESARNLREKERLITECTEQRDQLKIKGEELARCLSERDAVRREASALRQEIDNEVKVSDELRKDKNELETKRDELCANISLLEENQEKLLSEMEELVTERDELQNQIDKIKESKAYRLGEAVAAPVRWTRDKINS